MSDEKDIHVEAVDVADIQPWLEGTRSLTELRQQLPFLRSDEDAERYLDGIRRGLASIERGELYTTGEMTRELEKRRRARRAAA